MMICSRAPTRISFAGGGTDIPEIARITGGCVTSAAISRYVHATLKERDGKTRIHSIRLDGAEAFLEIDSKISYDGNLDLVKSVVEELGGGRAFDITITSNVPEHSGLGASASAYAALIALFNSYYDLGLSKKDIAELSFKLETTKLKNKVGKQDQYAACYGGLNFMEFSKDMKVNVSAVKTSASTLAGLEKDIALLYVAKRQKTAGEVIESQKKSFKKEEFLVTKELGAKARIALEKNDLEAFGSVMSEVWGHKKRFSAETTTPLIEKMHRTAIENGAYGGKISGAGGGGCGFWFCRPGTKTKVVAALVKLGAQPLDFKFDFEGVKAWKI